MKRNEKLVIQGNEFYVIDLDCMEKKSKQQMKKEMIADMKLTNTISKTKNKKQNNK